MYFPTQPIQGYLLSTLVSEHRTSFCRLATNRRFWGVGKLLLALCIITSAAYGQGTTSQAIVTFSVDSANCSANDPNGGSVWNYGTIYLTINNTETESAIYQCQTAGAPYDYIQNLANRINANSPWVTAVVLSDASYGFDGGSLWLMSKATGTSANYPISVSASYDSNDPFAGPAYVPSAPTAMTGGATSRNFIMGAWFDVVPGADEDIAFFYATGNPSMAGNDIQLPTGLSIMDLFPFAGQYTLPTSYQWTDQNGQHTAPYDYNRIAAVVLDEPFWQLGNDNWANPCGDARYSSMVNVAHSIQALAQAMRQKTPKTRLWINYSEPEVQWMMNPNCNGNSMAFMNGSFIDVVSMDKYRVPFAGTSACLAAQQQGACVQPYYDWLIANRGHSGQQIAFVPGIEFKNSPSNDAQIQASYLQGFFDYATQKQACNLSLGNTGATGHADGCLVWIVIGFTPHDNFPYAGEDDPGGQPIQQLWRSHVSLPSTIALTKPSTLATVLSSGIPVTNFFTAGEQVFDISCTSATSCGWDDPSGDANAPAAAWGSPLSVVSTPNGLTAYFLTPSGHVISLDTSHGFSDTWQDVTAAGGNFTAATGSPLVTVMSGQTPISYFLIGSGEIIDNWCTSATSCAWDNPSGDAHAPAAAAGSPLNVVATANGLTAFFLTPSGHLISLDTSHGFSDTWQDITATGGNFTAAAGSPLVTVMSGQTPISYFLIGSGEVIDNWCTSATSCAWDDPSGDAHAPAAASGSALSVVSTANGLVAYFLTSSGHVISLNTSHGFSDTWQDITTAAGAPAAASESPLTTVVSSSGTLITHFVNTTGHLYSITCTSSGQCTSTDETANAHSAPVGFF